MGKLYTLLNAVKTSSVTENHSGVFSETLETELHCDLVVSCLTFYTKDILLY